MMNTETPHEAGYRWRTKLDDSDRELLDVVIILGNKKITAIRYLRSKTGLGLSASKALYEAREEFLRRTPNPYGF